MRLRQKSGCVRLAPHPMSDKKYYVKYDSVRQAFRLLVADDATLQIHQSVD